MTGFLEQVKWNDDGLAPVVTQEAGSGRLLMLAWANRAALELAVRERRGIYWSRSRGCLWRKGESSGNSQRLIDVFLDCDGDALCYLVEQRGGVACHTGRVSCFHRRLNGGTWVEAEPALRDPREMYG